MGLISGIKRLRSIRRIVKFIPGHAKRVARKAKFASRKAKISALRQQKKLDRAKNIQRLRRNRKFREALPNIGKTAKRVAIGGGIAGASFAAGRFSRRKNRHRRSTRR